MVVVKMGLVLPEGHLYWRVQATAMAGSFTPVTLLS